MSKLRKAYVYVSNIYAGVLQELDDGYYFIYDENYLSSFQARSVSLTLPLTRKEHFSKVFFPFFDGLIPEGWLLETVSKDLKIDYNDRFGLLLLSCNDPIGNVSIKKDRV